MQPTYGTEPRQWSADLNGLGQVPLDGFFKPVPLAACEYAADGGGSCAAAASASTAVSRP